jgi:hypothetical protein
MSEILLIYLERYRQVKSIEVCFGRLALFVRDKVEVMIFIIIIPQVNI